MPFVPFVPSGWAFRGFHLEVAATRHGLPDGVAKEGVDESDK